MKILFWFLLSWIILGLICYLYKCISFLPYLREQIKTIHYELCEKLSNYSHKELNIIISSYIYPDLYCKIFPSSVNKLYLMNDIMNLKEVEGWKIAYSDKKTLILTKYFFKIFIIFA